MDLFIIKIGGSVITDKSEKFSVREGALKRVSNELASIEGNFVLVHGGGSFGHPLASEYDISSGYSKDEQLIGFSKTHKAMERLNSKVVNALMDAGLPALGVQTSACTIVEDDKIISMETRNIKKLIDLGIAPVLYGDSVPDLKKGMTILSGDQLVSHLARNVQASKVVLGVDTDGVYTRDPKVEEDAELIPEITPETWNEISKKVDFHTTGDVTGGMKNKVEVLLELANEGIESQIVNATKPRILKRAIRSDKRVGTNINTV